MNRVSVYVTDEQAEQLRSIALAAGSRSVASIIREIILPALPALAARTSEQPAKDGE